jgi:hypothetical protein
MESITLSTFSGVSASDGASYGQIRVAKVSSQTYARLASIPGKGASVDRTI